MNVIADIKIITEDGKRVLFDEKRVVQTESNVDVMYEDLVNVESLSLNFRWVEPYKEN